MNYYTYIYRDPARGNEPFYVGKGKGKRAFFHLTRKDMHPLTQRLAKMARNGVKPDIEIIPALDENHALFMEECLINVVGRKDLGEGTLLNLTDGGEGTPKHYFRHTAESKAKISAAHTGKKRSQQARENMRAAKVNKPLSAKQIEHITSLKVANTGRKHNPETNLKKSLSSKGHVKSEETKARMKAAWVLRRAQKVEV